MQLRALVLASLLALPAFGATYHVRTDGSDANCNGTVNVADSAGVRPNCAEATIQAGVTDWSGSGNTTLVHVGTYNTNCHSVIGGDRTAQVLISTAGTSGAYNVLKTANDGTVTVDGPCHYGIYINAQFVQIGSLTPGEGFTFGRLFTLASSSGVWHGVVAFFQPNGRVYGNTFLGTTAINENGTIDTNGEILFHTGGIDVENNNITLAGVGTAIQFSTTADCGTDCDGTISCNGPGTITGNTVIWDGTVNNQRHTGVFAHGSHDIVVERNYFQVGTSSAPALGGSFGVIYNRANCRWTVRNNYIQAWGSTIDCYYHQEGLSGNTAHDRHIVTNNTCYGSMPAGNPAWLFKDCQNCEFTNNITIGASSGSIGEGVQMQNTSCDPNMATSIMSHNDYSNVTTRYVNTCITACSGSPISCPNDSTASPSLNLSGAKPVPFFRLSSAASPMIGIGRVDSATPATDYDGDTRGAAVDIGADEFLSGGGAVCGNNLAEAGESCDGTDLAGATCVSRGFAQGGTLACNANCTFNTVNCCGDNVKGSLETCDGTDLNSQTCVSQGFSGGVLACSANCASFNTGGCTVSTINSATAAGVTCVGCTIQ